MPRKRKHVKVVQATLEVELPKVTEAKTPLDLPPRYMMFPDDLEYSVKRIGELEEKLFDRKVRVVKPLSVFRHNNMLAIEVEKIQ